MKDFGTDVKMEVMKQALLYERLVSEKTFYDTYRLFVIAMTLFFCLRLILLIKHVSQISGLTTLSPLVVTLYNVTPASLEWEK